MQKMGLVGHCDCRRYTARRLRGNTARCRWSSTSPRCMPRFTRNASPLLSSLSFGLLVLRCLMRFLPRSAGLRCCTGGVTLIGGVTLVSGGIWIPHCRSLALIINLIASLIFCEAFPDAFNRSISCLISAFCLSLSRLIHSSIVITSISFRYPADPHKTVDDASANWPLFYVVALLSLVVQAEIMQAYVKRVKLTSYTA